MKDCIIKNSRLCTENSKGFVWNHNSGVTVKTIIMYALSIDVIAQRERNNYYTPGGQENQNLDICVA